MDNGPKCTWWRCETTAQTRYREQQQAKAAEAEAIGDEIDLRWQSEGADDAST